MDGLDSLVDNGHRQHQELTKTISLIIVGEVFRFNEPFIFLSYYKRSNLAEFKPQPKEEQPKKKSSKKKEEKKVEETTEKSE